MLKGGEGLRKSTWLIHLYYSISNKLYFYYLPTVHNFEQFNYGLSKLTK